MDGIRAIPARSIAGGEEEVGEKGQGSSAHLGVVGVGLETVGGGGSTTEQRWRRGSSKSCELGPVCLGLKASMEVEEGHGLPGLWNVGRRRSVHGEHSSPAVEDVGGGEKHDAGTGVPIYRPGMWRNHPK